MVSIAEARRHVRNGLIAVSAVGLTAAVVGAASSVNYHTSGGYERDETSLYASMGILRRDGYHLSFPSEGVVFVERGFNKGLKEVGDLCGVPKSMTRDGGGGYIGVDDPKCLAPLKGELSGSVQIGR